MIVADSSYLVQGLLVDRTLLRGDKILTPDIAIYEIVNTIWKYRVLLHRVRDAAPHLGALFGLQRSGMLVPLKPTPELMTNAYDIALRNGASPYDMAFVALALDAGLELRSLDQAQLRIMRMELDRT